MSDYTCFDMMRDCRAAEARGWTHFVTHFLPACRWLLLHYTSSDEQLEDFLRAVHASADGPIRTLQPAPERELMVHVRDYIVDRYARADPAPDPLGLEPFQAALEDLTPIEKQLVWIHLLGYPAEAAAAMMRMHADTGRQTLERAGALLGSLDPARAAAATLQQQARAQTPENPIPWNVFLHAIDGRLDWSSRHDLDKQLSLSWHEVDRFCRIREADEALRAASPLAESDTARYLELLGIAPPKPTFWKRIFARGAGS
ncbi:MAG: hypothetical protein GY953_54050 [bacterium]|nr:hypothetical protein [bacterium]